jgi:hypothetical protein
VPTSPSNAFPALCRPLFISSLAPSSYRSHFSMSSSSSTSHGPLLKTAQDSAVHCHYHKLCCLFQPGSFSSLS